MSHLAPWASLLLLVHCAAANASPQVLEVGPNGLVPGLVAGQPIRWLLDPSGASAPVLNPDAVRLLGRRRGGATVFAAIGPVRVAGRSTVFDYAVAGIAMRRRGAWFDRAISMVADGLVGPGGVRQPIIRFSLRRASGGESERTLPLVNRGNGGMGTMIGDVFVQFDPRMQRSLVTAAGGGRLAEQWGGQLSGAVQSRVVRLDVSRPVRRLILERPMTIGNVRLYSVDVRTRDFGNINAIPDADTDPNEILVTARGRPSRNQRRVLILGADALSGCSSITFDKPRRQIRLRCAAQ